MDQVDCCLLATQAVAESGGIINSIGPFSLALLARSLHRSVYVLTERLKLHRNLPSLSKTCLHRVPKSADAAVYRNSDSFSYLAELIKLYTG
jgi:translation initiation factor 2B subunit (eIF-2B alpha/beta/delta family)